MFEKTAGDHKQNYDADDGDDEDESDNDDVDDDGKQDHIEQVKNLTANGFDDDDDDQSTDDDAEDDADADADEAESSMLDASADPRLLELACPPESLEYISVCFAGGPERRTAVLFSKRFKRAFFPMPGAERVRSEKATAAKDGLRERTTQHAQRAQGVVRKQTLRGSTRRQRRP